MMKISESISAPDTQNCVSLADTIVGPGHTKYV